MKFPVLIYRYIKISLHYFSREKAKMRQGFFLFFIFLVLSSAIWFINALRKNYITTVGFPVKYINSSNERLAVGEMPSYIFLLVKCSGYTILQYKIKPPTNPINIDLNKIASGKINDKNPRYYLQTSLLSSNIENQLTNEVKVLDIEPDTIFFQFDKVYKKKVPVVPAVKVEFMKQYSFMDIPLVKPDSIWVYGPKFVIDTIHWVKTETITLKNVNKSIEKRLELQKQYYLTYSVKHVLLNLPVEKFTEARISVPVEVKNLPDSLAMKVVPDLVTVTCQVGLSNYEKIKPYYFKATVDYKSIKDNLNRKLKVSVDAFPRMISGLRILPQKVDYIIKKKK